MELYECIVCGKGALPHPNMPCEDCVKKYGSNAVSIQVMTVKIVEAGYGVQLCPGGISLFWRDELIHTIPMLGDFSLLYHLAMKGVRSV